MIIRERKDLKAKIEEHEQSMSLSDKSSLNQDDFLDFSNVDGHHNQKQKIKHIMKLKESYQSLYKVLFLQYYSPFFFPKKLKNN